MMIQDLDWVLFPILLAISGNCNQTTIIFIIHVDRQLLASCKQSNLVHFAVFQVPTPSNWPSFGDDMHGLAFYWAFTLQAQLKFLVHVTKRPVHPKFQILLLSNKFSDIWSRAVENAKCQSTPTPHVAASLKRMRSKPPERHHLPWAVAPAQLS
jgi:hypothetical protein